MKGRSILKSMNRSPLNFVMTFYSVRFLLFLLPILFQIILGTSYWKQYREGFDCKVTSQTRSEQSTRELRVDVQINMLTEM
jgi:hypothetical protein